MAKRRFIFLLSKYFDFEGYDILFRHHSIHYEKFEFDKTYFENLQGYNRLLITEQFYKRFVHVDFILIYQTDAFVFRDELDKWCTVGYDYVGAPWNGIHLHKDIPLVGVGNGGFSLRNVKSTIKVLKKLRLLEVLKQYKNSNWKGVIPRLPTLVYKLVKAKKIASDFEKNYTFQEDVFWCKDAPAQLKNFMAVSTIIKSFGKILLRDSFSIAPVEKAAKFSIETNPTYFYKMNKEQLPFGCHAWKKYEPEFWEPFIHSTLNKHSNSENGIS